MKGDLNNDKNQKNLDSNNLQLYIFCKDYLKKKKKIFLESQKIYINKLI